MSGMLIPLAVFAAVTILAAALLFIFKDFGGSAAEDRLEILTGQKSARLEEAGIMKDDLASAGASLTSAMSRVFKGLENLPMFFEQADSPVRPDQFFLLSGGFLVAGVVLAWATHAPMPLWPVMGIIFSALPFMWLSFRRKRRFKNFGKQMPDAMELIARALRSGHSLNSGIHVVVEEMPDPIATEFMLAYEEQNLGVPIEVALKSMLKRMPNMDLKFFVTAVAIQKQAGGDLAEVLDKIGYIIRERFKIMGQVQALTGEGRLSAIVLQAMPICLFMMIYYINPEYVMMLFTDQTGKQMLAGAIFMQILGAFAIKKIIAIKI